MFWGTFLACILLRGRPIFCFFCVCGFWPPCFPPPPPENGGGGQGPLAPPPLDPRLDSCIAYHNLIVWRWRLFPHTTWDYLYVVSHRIVFVVHRCNWTYFTARHPHGTRTAPARHPHGTRTTHLLTVGSPHDCRPATGDRSYGRLTIKLFQFLKGTARTS